MQIKSTLEILWGETSGSYMYGSTIRHHEKRHVEFINPLLASGNQIKSWDMIVDYQAGRVQPSLPLLKKGEQYFLEGQYDTFPKDSVFLKISFFDRYDNEVDTIVSKETQVIFTYPKEAYSYRISLLSAGLEKLDFYSLKIKKYVGEDV